MEKFIKGIYDNAINTTFSREILEDDSFDSCCYQQMIDETHSIVIWGTGYSPDERCYVVSIREGASENDLFGKNEIACDETPDNSYGSLYFGIEEKVNKFFINKLIKETSQQLDVKEDIDGYGCPRAWVTLPTGKTAEIILDNGYSALLYDIDGMPLLPYLTAYSVDELFEDIIRN